MRRLIYLAIGVIVFGITTVTYFEQADFGAYWIDSDGQKRLEFMLEPIECCIISMIVGMLCAGLALILVAVQDIGGAFLLAIIQRRNVCDLLPELPADLD